MTPTTVSYRTEPFPLDLDNRPPAFAPLASEPIFDPARHLALEVPTQIETLGDFGYSAEEIADCPSDFAVTNVFRVLSEEGAACLYEVCKQLENFTTSNERIQRCMRGGAYRSKFLRDMCLSPDIAEFMSEIAGVALMPHTIAHQLGHLNYAPETVGTNVDKWHVDTLRYDYVMFVTDPQKNEGGAFQYFRGTKHEMAELRASGQAVPADRVASPNMPGPGYAVLQQGNMVVHQAKGLTAPGERITMVNGYIAQDPSVPDFTRYDQLMLADPADVVTTEYSRHVASQGRRMLQAGILDGEFSADRDAYADQLSAVAQMLAEAAEEIRTTTAPQMEHFGD